MSLEKGTGVSAKIADFGLSRMKSSSQMGETLSTYQWMAPETLGTDGAKVEYDEKADVYSFGIVLWEMLTLGFPFDEFLSNPSYTYTNPNGALVFNETMIKRAIEKDQLRPSLPSSCPEMLKELVCKCWSHSPSDRPTFESITEQLAPEREFSSGGISHRASRLSFAIDYRKKPQIMENIENHSQCVKKFELSNDIDAAPSAIVADKIGKRIWIGCLNGDVIVFDVSNPQVSMAND
jgi:serine/threonine protein kinase